MKNFPEPWRRALGAAPLACALAVLCGCRTLPPPPPPAPAPVPARYLGAWPAGDGAAARAVGSRWWELFDDPVLTGLVTRTLDANYDLRLADARLHEARAVSIETDTALRPSVRAAAEYRRQHQPSLEKNRDPLVNQFAVSGFDASWEADLFGRVRSLATAARASVEAQAAVRSDLAVTLAAEVARNYFDLRGRQQSLAAMKQSVRLLRVELDLTRRRAALGAANRAEIATVQQSIASRGADLADLEAAIARTIQRLSVLTVQPADGLASALAAPDRPAAEPGDVALGTPADLLRGRPDIRQAEEELVASAAVQEAARADLFPRLTFSGQLSFFAFGWGLGPNLSWDVFDRRQVRARQAQAGARADAAFARYQLAVLGAVEEVENALANLQAEKNRRDALRSGRETAAELVELTRRRTALGVANQFEVVAAERAESDAAGALARQEAAVREAWVAVIKALGGGWRAPAGTASPNGPESDRPPSVDPDPAKK